jgi:thiosulfate/3-mercaptopyruvate sulfurtransferase
MHRKLITIPGVARVCRAFRAPRVFRISWISACTWLLPLLGWLAFAVRADAEPGPPAAKPGAATPAPGAASDAAALPLTVSPAWLDAHLHDRDLVLLHIGAPEGYQKQHIPGARAVALADIAVQMQGDDGLHLEMLPAEELRHRLEKLGISNDAKIVVYVGEDWVSPATRVVFTLDAAGLGGRTALLDGGMPAWQREGHAVTAAATPARTATLAPLAMRPIVVTATTVMASLGKPGVAVVDARDRAFYDGTQTGASHDHAHRTGHIAGALSIPFDSVFDDKLVLRPAADLEARFAQAGVKPGDTVIGYCHVGQQATAMLFAARRLGHPVLLYDGSFEDWSRFHPGYPVETAPTKADAVPAKADAVPAKVDAVPAKADAAPTKADAPPRGSR